MVLALLLMGCASSGARSQDARGDKPKSLITGSVQHATLQSGRYDREYFYYIPKAYDGTPTPLVFVLHGGAATVKHLLPLKNQEKLAEKYGYILVYPQGLRKMWNVYESPTTDDSKIWPKGSPDDVAFFTKIVKELSKIVKIDRSRLYATGISAGGLMSYRLACESKVKAIGPIAANMIEDYIPDCKPKKPISVILFSGTEDSWMPYKGGNIRLSKRRVVSSRKSAEFWASRNGCSLRTDKEDIPDINKKDKSTVTKETFRNCPKNTDTHFYTVVGGGHTGASIGKSGGEIMVAQLLLGTVNQDMDSDAAIFAFFNRH